MRLWSIHPKYLDAKGLVALWRETLLAKNVLQGKTKGYKKHPQLIRFKNQPQPINSINNYLKEVYSEAAKRKYNFDNNKVGSIEPTHSIRISAGQIEFEFSLLMKKVQIRDPARYQQFKDTEQIELHPLFVKIPGPVEDWEKV